MNLKLVTLYFGLIFFSLHETSYAALDCSAKVNTLPFSNISAGKNITKIPLEHIIVIMQENHSFDRYFGKLNRPQFYGKEVDGISWNMNNKNGMGNTTYVYHEARVCTDNPTHSWGVMHDNWNNGKNDHFVVNSGPKTMGYYEETELPFYYALANNFAISDRYFSSVLGPTFPNRFFLLTGSALGKISNSGPWSSGGFSQKTIFDLLGEFGISWKYYADWKGYLRMFSTYQRNKNNFVSISQYKIDLQNGTLPKIVFLESKEDIEDEHPSANVQVGQAWVADKVKSLMNSPYWENSTLFLTYDEAGGFFDHVSPPEACAPETKDSNKFNRYGFRVPFVAISPYVKRHYVSHLTYDHTSILKFIETKFNLPALTKRDANANNLLDLFDFGHPDFSIPNLPVTNLDQIKHCDSHIN